MGRPRRQEGRRAQLVAAAQRVLARDGLVGLRVRAVALEAGVSPASVVYYYPDTYALAVEALTLSVRELATERAAVAASVPDPRERLNALLDLELGDGDHLLWRAFCEIPGQVPDHPQLTTVLADLLADRVATLTAVIEDGVAAGAFTPIGSVDLVAHTVSAVAQCETVARWCRLETPARSRARVDAVVAATLLGAGVDHPARPAPARPVPSRPAPVAPAPATR